MDAIASLPLMDDFQLAMDDKDVAIYLVRLSELRKFVVRGRLASSVLVSLAEMIGNSPDLSHLVISVPNSLTPRVPFSKKPSLRYLAVRASQLDLNLILHIIDSFSLEYNGLDSNVYIDLARARLFCSRVIVYYVDLMILHCWIISVNALAPCRNCPYFYGETPVHWLDVSGQRCSWRTLLHSRFVLAVEVDGVSVIRPFTRSCSADS